LHGDAPQSLLERRHGTGAGIVHGRSRYLPGVEEERVA
jgi:hypothetical protein